MTNILSNISTISVIDRFIYPDFTELDNLEYEISPIGAGGFGTVYKLINPKYVIKIFHDKTVQKHAYETIALLHDKLKRYPKETGAYILQDFPELLGLPFAVFEALDSEKQEIVTVLVMHNLTEEGFIDFGGEGEDINKLKQLGIEDKLILCYKLSKVIDFLHSIKFIHSDLSENSIWIHPTNAQIALIDYDSGYHYDKQKEPTTIGKITHWLDSNFKKLFNRNPINNPKNLSITDRFNSEYWILANAIFELIFNTNPYFYLVDADHQTKLNYSNSYDWPNIDTSSDLFQKHNEPFYLIIIDYLQEFSNNGLDSLVNSFKKVFGKGYDNPDNRLTSKDWMSILSQICKEIEGLEPSITHYISDKTNIYSNKEKVVFEWRGLRYNKAYLNDNLVPYQKNQISLSFPDSMEVILRLVNDFGQVSQELQISAVKVDPQILTFDADKYVRDDMYPITLNWDTKEVDYVLISSSNKQQLPSGVLKVEPMDYVTYTLTAVGHFGEKVCKELNIDVVYPKILEFSWEVNLHKGLNNVDLRWETEYAEKVLLEPLAGERMANGIEHISINGEIIFTLTAIGLYKSVKKELIAEPFGIPKIKQIELQLPDFQLNNTINTSLTRIPIEFTQNSKIIFNNNLYINNTDITSDEFLNSLNNINYSISDEINIIDKPNKNFFSNIKNDITKIIKKLQRHKK
jgi:serine/threonine protein kinase